MIAKILIPIERKLKPIAGISKKLIERNIIQTNDNFTIILIVLVLNFRINTVKTTENKSSNKNIKFARKKT